MLWLVAFAPDDTVFDVVDLGYYKKGAMIAATKRFVNSFRNLRMVVRVGEGLDLPLIAYSKWNGKRELRHYCVLHSSSFCEDLTDFLFRE